jgi:hypothetical protein
MKPENVIPAITLIGAGNLAIVATCHHHHHVSHDIRLGNSFACCVCIRKAAQSLAIICPLAHLIENPNSAQRH